MLKQLLSVAAISACLFAQSQETRYEKVTFSEHVPPTMPQYSDYKTYDVSLLTSKGDDKPGTGFNLAYKVKVGELTQVESGGEFHIVSLLQRYAGKWTSPSTVLVSVALNTTVYNKYGTVVATGSVVNEQYNVKFDHNLTKEEMAPESSRRLVLEKIIEASVRPLTDRLYGATINPLVRLGSISDVKKASPLRQFDDQVKALRPVLEKEGLAGFKTAAQPYLSYWEEQSNYSGEEKNKDEVKRAALQNLAVYYIADRNYDKAGQYIEQYKPIDKEVKELFGLVKYKNSEELAKLITTITPAVSTEKVATTGDVLSNEQILNNFHYIVINGSITIKDKKNSGNYEGIIKVNKIPQADFGNIVSLDPENIDVIIETKDVSGQPLTINTTIAKIQDLKDKNGNSFIMEKFGTAVLGDGSYYTFMQSTFVSPKVNVYRAVLPAGSSDYVVRKAGDDKGVKSSLFNARKNLEEYLGDCPVVSEKVKAGEIDRSTPVEKVAELYSNCK